MQFYSLRPGDFIISLEVHYTNVNDILINSYIFP